VIRPPNPVAATVSDETYLAVYVADLFQKDCNLSRYRCIKQSTTGALRRQRPITRRGNARGSVQVPPEWQTKQIHPLCSLFRILAVASATVIFFASLARILHQLACKIAQEFDRLKDFPSERNNGVYFRGRKILQAIKD